MNLPCSVIADLLPIYAENLASTESRALVEAHLQTCTDCRKRLEKLKTPAALPAADPAPLKKLQGAVRRKRRIAVWLAVLLSLAAAVAAFGALSTPEFLPQERAVRLETRADGLVTVEFLPGVTGYELTRETPPDSDRVDYSISAYTTALSRLFGRGTPQEIVLNPQRETLGTVYYCEMNGSDDVVLYGAIDGGRITLPRHALVFYALLALAAAVAGGLVTLIFRKNIRLRGVFLDLTLLPTCYLAAQLCITGIRVQSYTLTRDFLIIALLTALLYAACVLLHREVLKKRA